LTDTETFIMLRLPDQPGLCFPAILLLLALLALPAQADSGLLNASLGRWLDTEVLPELGRTLGEHPRFKGETIKLVSLTAGQPTDRASRLHEAVEAHLTQRLLKTSGVRIAWSDQPQNHCGVLEQPAYLLGIAIETDGSYYHKLNIRMIDVTESVWVSGVSHSWRGRLTATESAALSQAVTSAAAGSVDSPLPVRSSREIAATMQRHLRCAHPQGLNGPVYLAQGEDADLNRILASLATELATSPIAALTSEAATAEWVLSLKAAPAGTGNQVQQLGLLLTEQDREITQQVATVYVSGSNRRTGYPPRQIARSAATASYLPNGELLSDLRLHPAEEAGVCDARKARGNQCAEVVFDLRSPAYLFVLSSTRRKLASTTCESTLKEATAGERRFRVRVPPSVSALPDAGIYAIAVSDRTAARALARHIRTGVCSRPLARSDAWLSELDNLLATHPDHIQWRAIHLSHAPEGVVQL
jgi:hypothetical protein